MVWEVRTDGASDNGGGFDPVSGTPGTDYSQQAAAQVTYTDLVIDGTTDTNCTSVATPFTSAHVGNVINITSGTGFTVQRVQIMSVAAGVATCDKSLGTLSSTGGNGKLGGALIDWSNAGPLVVAGNTVFIKAGTYTETTTFSYSTAGTAPLQIKWVGYNTDRTFYNTDTKPLITTATNSTVLLTSIAINFNVFRNISFSNSAGTRAQFITNGTTGSSPVVFDRCIFDGFTSVTNSTTSSATSIQGAFAYCELKNCTGYAIIKAATGGWVMQFCYIHDNAGGCSVGSSSNAAAVDLEFCIIANNSGRGWYSGSTSVTTTLNARNCIFYNNTTANIELDGNAGQGAILILINNIIYGSIDGVNQANADNVACRRQLVAHNAYGGQSGSARVNFDAGEGDITLTGDPFTDGANGDFSLNNVAGAGAALRATGFPSSYPGGLTTNYADVGAAQHQDSPGVSSSSSVMIQRNLPDIRAF